MLGKPKYKCGDKVKFKIDGEMKEGTIEIIDANGTFFDNSNVFYDILCDNILYKHLREDILIY